MTDSSIHELIPHRGPMLLVDEIVQVAAGEIICRKTFRADEFFFQGHYPDNPLVPGVILCECAAQSAAILLASQYLDSQTANSKVPVLTRMNKVRFRNTVHPGDMIDIKVRLDEEISGAFFLTASIRKDGKVAVSLELACTLAPRPPVQASLSDKIPPAPKSKLQPHLNKTHQSSQQG